MSTDKESQEPYISRDGFVRLPLLRGLTEILPWLQDVHDRGGLVCGGYARWCASPCQNPVPGSDVDVYPQDQASFDALKAYFIEKGLEQRHENNMCVTYKRTKDGPFMATPPVQLIKPVIEGAIVAAGSVEVILSNFDFTIIRAGIVPGPGAIPWEVLVDADYPHDEPRTLLRIKNIHCPISSTLRFMKYARKGYWARPMEIVKLFTNWDARDEEYRAKLMNYLMQSNAGEGLTKEQVEELEELMRID